MLDLLAFLFGTISNDMDKKFFMFLVVIPVLPILLLIDNL